MSYRRFFVIRIPTTLIAAAIISNTTSYYLQNTTYGLLALFSTAIIGLGITTVQFTRLPVLCPKCGSKLINFFCTPCNTLFLPKDKPETMNNGGVPLKEVPSVTDEEILEQIRKIAKGQPIEPEVVTPTKQIVLPQTKDFNTLAQEVLRQKIVAALERADFKLNVKGSIDSKGDMNFKKMEFGIKTGPQPVKEAVSEPEKKSPQLLKRPQR
jgi:hypothetical protein